jgi:hypothetical protein
MAMFMTVVSRRRGKKGRAPSHVVIVHVGKPGGHLLNLPAQVAVGQDGALADAGGAAGILIHGHIVEGHLGPCRGVGRALGDQVFPAVDLVGRLDIVGFEPFFLAHQGEEQVFGKGQIVADAGISRSV